MKNLLPFAVLLALTSCNMKPDRSNYQELQENEGVENYEVVEIYGDKFETTEYMLDSIGKQLIVYGKTNPKLKKDYQSQRKKISPLGDVLDNGVTNAVVKKDGSLQGFDFYSKWIISGDTLKNKYLDPFSMNEIDDPYEFEVEENDPEKWSAKFDELYNKAVYVYESSWNYYFKVENNWYFMGYDLEVVNEEFVKNHPPKEDQNVRMHELEDMSPKWSRPPEERDTDLIKEVGYESTYEEEVDRGLYSYGFSAGWWYLEIYMPFGDPIRIKRYSDFKSPNLELYKIPAAWGGRNDVLFVVQKPEELFPEQVGGMYVIRPRENEQPERRYKQYSTVEHPDGQIQVSKAVETEEYKKWKANHKN